MKYRTNELYQELELFDDNGVKIGEAEVDINGKMLSRLTIYQPYQNKGYGTEIIKKLITDYNIDCLWVNADNARAIHVYEKCGFTKINPTMWLMKREVGDSKTNNGDDDLISRQAAIDAATYGNPQTAWQRIEALPSAQPEQSESENITFWEKRAREYEEMVLKLTDEMARGIKIDSVLITEEGIVFKKEKPEQRWIPVSEKPIEKGLMLVTYNDGDVDLLKQPTAYRRSDIVAWMPRPKPYREEGNE